MLKQTIQSVGLALLSMASVLAAAEKPNVILIITDDQGYGDFSCHGNPVLKTPHMDRLHSQSVRFTDFHVAPMCSPTRGQLLTGVDAMKNGCTAVCQGRSMMRREFPTMPEFFAKAGYATGHFGKWHLGDSHPHRPQDRGFQETVHHRAWGITSLADHWENHTDVYFDPILSHNGVDKKYDGYCTDIFFDESMKWIEKVHGEERPFFLYLPTNTPHVPNICEEKYAKPYRGDHEGKPMPAEFYGMIANLDDNLGRLEAFLEEKGLRENTLLIYMSDNGTQSSQAKEIYNAGMRDKKTSVYEGGHRVPLFVRWPAGKLGHGRDIDELTQVQDLLPTLIELCGLGPADAAFDGTSLAGLMSGKSNALPDRKLVVQYRVSGAPWDPAVVLWNKWRLVGGRSLYHVGEDPGQTKDVAQEHPEIVKAMSDHYDSWYGEAKAQFDKRRWITVGSEQANPLILYAQDWVGGYCDNRGGLTRATAQGYWNVIVEKEGIYEIDLRRWPKESGKTLAEGIAGPGDKGNSARPITTANLQIAGGNYTLDAGPGATHVSFRVKLPAGKTQLSTTLMDAEGRALCSAIYVYLKRLDGSDAALTAPSATKPKEAAPPRPRKGLATRAPKAVSLAEGDVLLADFEGNSYGDWIMDGAAFGKGPTGPKGRVLGHQGGKLADTFLINGSDAPTGKLTSPSFPISHAYLNFLVGGGKTPGKTCVNLVVDGKVSHSATGTATKDGQNRKVMRWVSWDLSEIKGKQATLEIVDAASGGWGHIMVDQIFLSDAPAGAAKEAAKPSPAASVKKAPTADRPNIVFIFIDDMGYGDIAPFGNKVNKTPNLDRMAAEGNVLRQFYVSNTACTPSRSALMTGTYAHRIGMDGMVVFPGEGRGLHPDEITIAELLKGEDYATGCFGKWHLGDQKPFLPLAQGFDSYFGIPYSNDMWPGNKRGNPVTDRGPYEPLPVIRGDDAVAYVSDGADQSLLAEAITDEAVKFIKENRDRPFFCYIPHAYVHHPRYARPAILKKAAGSVDRANVEEVDTSVGRVLDTLRELGIDKKTLVIFTSDNGGAGGMSMGPLRGGKGGPKYEGHMRVPTVAWWPGTIAAGVETTEIATTIDVLPSLAKLAGAKLPEDRTIDGKDALDVLLGGTDVKSPHPVLFYEVDGIRRGDWKLVRVGRGGKKSSQLFNLKEDLGEKNNLAAKHPEIVKELETLLQAHAEHVAEDTRPAGSVENAKPILNDPGDLPRLRELMGMPEVKASQSTPAPKKGAP